MKTIRFGITGSGYMGRTHAEALRRLSNTELVAIWGGTRAPGLAQKYGAVCEPTLAALIGRSDLDAIVVTTPHHMHAEEAVLALSTGRHVLVEKPMATSVVDCDRMIAASGQRAAGTGNRLSAAFSRQQYAGAGVDRHWNHWYGPHRPSVDAVLFGRLQRQRFWRRQLGVVG